MEIDALNLRLRKNQDELDASERENRMNKDTIQGYNDSVVLSPHQVVDFPQQLRNNVRKIMEQLQTTDEKRYVKSLLDPFHPDALGVRVPTRVPRNTITYNTHCEYTFRATSASSDVIYFNNYEQMSGYLYVALTGDAVQNFLTNNPAALQNASIPAQDVTYDITYVDIGKKSDSSVEFSKNDSWHDNFFKLRCVAAGMRVLKTSKQETEGGSLDLVYSRDGSSFDEGHSFKTDLSRIRPDRVRTYLAGAGCSLRSTNGFVIQANKRPHDDHSLDLRDVKKVGANIVSSPTHGFAPHGHSATVWFVDLSTNIMYEPKDWAAIPDNSQVGIVLESLQQRHTSMAIAQGLQSGMTISFESVYHLEGIADQTAYGFTQATSARLRSAATSLQLLDLFPVQRIFSPYSVRRPELLEMILSDGHVRGFWDETMFPMIKDMVRYGADTLADSDFLDDVVDAFVDAAAGTLGYAAPAFLPAILAAAGEVKDPIHNMTTSALKAASQWAQPARQDNPQITGKSELTPEILPRLPRPSMIDTSRPSYGASVVDLE